MTRRFVVTAASKESSRKLQKADELLKAVADYVDSLPEDEYDEFFHVTGLDPDALLDAHRDLATYLKGSPDDFLE